MKVRHRRPDIGHRHPPNANREFMGQPWRGASPFRCLPIPRKPGTVVEGIAFVGDSIAMGWGVAEKETFASQVIAALPPSGRKVDGCHGALAWPRDVGAGT